DDPARAALRESMVQGVLANDPTGLRRAVGGVISRKAVDAAELSRIRAPTLVISGELDSAVVPARSMRTAARIPGARFVGLPRAGHTSSIEEPEAVNRILREFWDALPAA
ncbi:MAG TPA: alpha/beta hydrolase, partial [Myxococcales bacterium]|nr:alpha/beta hydrolase [Myxococcales bacterium]